MIDDFTFYMSIGLLAFGYIILFGFIFVRFIQPMKKTPAGKIIKAYRTKKPVIVTDENGFWRWHMTEKVMENSIRTEDGAHIKTPPGTIKYGDYVLFGVADGEQGITIKPFVMNIINELIELGITREDINNILRFREINATKEELINVREEIKEVDNNVQEEYRPAETG